MTDPLIDSLKTIGEQLSCLISYGFLLYGAGLTIAGFFFYEAALGTVPLAFVLAILHLLLQVFVRELETEEVVLSFAIDFGLIILGLMPGSQLREENLLNSLIAFVVAGFIMVAFVYPSIASRCGVW